jgi:hypothetical protein
MCKTTFYAPEGEGAYYVPYSFLLISYKFCNGGEQLSSFRHLSGPSSAIKFLYAPAPPPPTVWALKLPSWAPVHETTYAPMISALCIMLWMRAYHPGQVGGGWALEIESFFGPVMASS